MSKVEHGLAGRLAGRLPVGVRVTQGVVKEVLPMEGFDGEKVAFLSTTREERAVVLYRDIKSLGINPAMGWKCGGFLLAGRCDRRLLEKKKKVLARKGKKKVSAGGKLPLVDKLPK